VVVFNETSLIASIASHRNSCHVAKVKGKVSDESANGNLPVDYKAGNSTPLTTVASGASDEQVSFKDHLDQMRSVEALGPGKAQP
jgi:hypothetical protein